MKVKVGTPVDTTAIRYLAVRVSNASNIAVSNFERRKIHKLMVEKPRLWIIGNIRLQIEDDVDYDRIIPWPWWE
jgi:hypothetical protein